MASGFESPVFSPPVSLSHSLAFLLYLTVFTGLSEEIGWRGFALEELMKKFNPYKSSVILGVFWGVWHMPLLIYSNFNNLAALLPSIIGVIAGTIGWSIVVTWFYINSKSLPLTIYLHGFGNFLFSFGILSLNYTASNYFYGFAPWIVVFILEKQFGNKLSK